MADHGRLDGERVFCYECSNEWARSEGGLQCPRCQSEFVEILSNPPSPDPMTTAQRNPVTPPQHPLRNHYPWEDQDFPDPDEGDINTVRFNTNMGNGSISFTTRTYTRGGRTPIGNRGDDPAAREIGQDFTALLETLMGVQNRNRPRGFEPNGPPPMGGMGFFGGPPPGQRGGRAMNEPDFMATPFAPMFSAIFSTLGNLQPPNQGRRGPGADPDMPPHPLMLLQQLFNPQNAAHGDAVFTQEALDRVISQLMEQNAGSNAPGPATEEAIKSLPKRPIDASMLGSDGKAECSICMENVDVGEQATFLPCNHWFHDACVTAWLKEHDTCPHCRQGIMKSSNQPSSSQAETGRPSNSRRPSRRASATPPWVPAREGSRATPRSIPESPVRQRERDAYYDRPGIPPPPAQQSRRDSNRSGSSGNGGVTGWLRNHNPFGPGSS